MRVVALVPAAGRGERLRADLPKALVTLRGQPLVWHAVRSLLGSDCVDSVVVAAPPDAVEAFRVALDGVGLGVAVVAGGDDRTVSVARALAAADPAAEVVLVHDAARCLAPLSLIRDVVEAVRSLAGAVLPVLPVADTLKEVDASGHVLSTVDRWAVRAAQTPQGFPADLLRRAYARGSGPATDDAGLVERLGEPVVTVPGHQDAFKITTEFDLAVADTLLAVR